MWLWLKIGFWGGGIDSLAGPSKILIIGEGSVKPTMQPQFTFTGGTRHSCTYGTLTPNQAGMRQLKALLEQLPLLPRRKLPQALRTGAIILTEDLETAGTLSEIAQNIRIISRRTWSYLAQVKHAGAMHRPYT